jgi:hypothetical protein
MAIPVSHKREIQERIMALYSLHLLLSISVEGETAKPVLAQKCMGVGPYSFVKCLIQFLQRVCSETECGPPRATWRTTMDHSLRNTGLEKQLPIPTYAII